MLRRWFSLAYVLIALLAAPGGLARGALSPASDNAPINSESDEESGVDDDMQVLQNHPITARHQHGRLTATHKLSGYCPSTLLAAWRSLGRSAFFPNHFIPDLIRPLL
jgi:hypothetical protein